MIVINLITIKDNKPLKDKIIYILKNKELILFIFLAISILVFILNLLICFLGFGIAVSIENPVLFCYTLFTKIVQIKILIIILFSLITKEIKIEYFSISIPSIICMFIFGGLNYYYIIPLVEVILALFYTKLNNIFNLLNVFIEKGSITCNTSETFKKGIFNMISKCPILGRYLAEWVKCLSMNNFKYITSPFRVYYSNIFRKEIIVYHFTKLSKFTTIYIAKPVYHQWEFSFNYNDSSNTFSNIIKNNWVDCKKILYKTAKDYLNIKYNIKLISADYLVDVNAKFTNGILTELNLDKTNLSQFKPKLDKILGLSQYGLEFSSKLSFLNYYDLKPAG